MQTDKLRILRVSLSPGRIMAILIVVIGTLGAAASIDAFVKGGNEAGAVVGLGPGFVLLMLTGILLMLEYRLGLWLSYLWAILSLYPILILVSEWPNLVYRNVPEIVVYGSFELLFLAVVVYFQRRVSCLRKIRLGSRWSSKTPS